MGIVTVAAKTRALTGLGVQLEGLAWSTAPSGLRYRLPEALGPVASPSELRARTPIDGLVADGDRAAYGICGTIGAWRPGSHTPVSIRGETPPLCGPANFYVGVGALAGDRVAWNTGKGPGTLKYGWLTVAPVVANAPQSVVSVPLGHTGPDPRGDARSGNLLGDGSLLVFSAWAFCTDLGQPCVGIPAVSDTRILTETLWRVREDSWPGACPIEFRPPGALSAAGRCQELRREPGPLRPLDVDAGRIVASGDNETLVLDEDGRQLLSLPVSTHGAQLAGPDLVVLLRGQLRTYDASTGAPLHAWPLPDIRLCLEDAARGLAVYLVDGKAHLLRLSDGADVVVAAATAARFGDTGLFYAYQRPGPWPGRIRFVPFDRLPLK